ncbi:hypothetical protein HDU83_000650 [Entophlyctis luteolus]|nr:hypothetical protein HDU83_000650 [Entophlyctis luteolus]
MFSINSRLSAIEGHMRIKVGSEISSSLSIVIIHERIKLLEDTLIDLEEKYPQWSAALLDHSTRDFSDPFGPAVWTSVHRANQPSKGGNFGQNSLQFAQSRGILDFGSNISDDHRESKTNEVGALGGKKLGSTSADMDSIDRRILELKEKLLGKDKKKQ